MKELDIFLKALASRLELKKSIFVPKYVILPTKINTVKTYDLEVWQINNESKSLISSIKLNINVSEVTEDEIKNKLLLGTITNILKHFGI